MVRNYIKTAWRTLLRNKTYTAINSSGLAAGIAACLLIFVVVQFELSYDTFQNNYDRIYRIVSTEKHTDGSIARNPGIPCPAYDALKTDFPQLEKIVPLVISSGNQVTVLGTDANSDVAASKKFIEDNKISFTVPAYFDMFSAKWISGNAATLKDPGNVVLTKKNAQKYFGDYKNAVGKFIKIDNSVLLKVSGIIGDAPLNSDMNMGVFISYESFKTNPDNFGYSTEWGNLSSNHQIFVLLPKNVSAASIQSQLPAFVKKYYKQNDSRKAQVLQPFKDIHFDAGYGSLGDHSTDKNVLWTLAFIGVLIIVMASINFINLSTAQAIGRSKEVGIRKVLGSKRSQLIAQVMGETFLIVLFASILAVFIAKLAMPFLSNVASVPEGIALITAQTIIFLLAVLVVVTLLSGIYPALIVSGFKPVLALKSRITSASVGGISLRRVLVVTQFAISQMLIIGTIVAVSQMNHVRNADLGFNKEALLIMPAYTDSTDLARMEPLRQQMLQNPGVTSVSFGSDEVSSNNNWASNFAFDHKEDEGYPVFHKFGDAEYLKTYGVQLLAGRNYAASDTTNEIIINETLLHKLGFTDAQKIIGKDLRIGGGHWLPIVGVVKDFKTNSLKEETKPLTIAARKDFYFTIAVKINTANLSKTTAQIQKLWEKAYPEFAFSSHFADETIESFYRQETQLSLLYKIFAGIAIFISCLGLYGLVSFMASQKTKEVGIRKVLGASVSSIVVMFSKEFTILISIAFIIAVPVAWYFMNGWLQDFQYRISIGVGVFALAIVVSLIVAWVTVGYKAVRAALVNPVKSLRSE
ncbi:FtsX-like permease family protein [Panacibacter ginsenosidivorans]|uniref:FtsX-like permease family protein n=1 Tax=Panacibacter ginsenosidivorans TaxID=1813871 RepID=A0A5B8V5A3_9BACT|nr:ABC transporter permease [Panacibacter ginsenosidivorans]QEC65983.1 FtsX-like permease family protein [Panacibacter ginsenosidivorans]